jgi:hypothetical protein
LPGLQAVLNQKTEPLKNPILFLAVCVTLAVFSSCKKKAIRDIESDMTSGTWKVSELIYHAGDSTANYANDTFMFQSDGTYTITGTHNLTGNWRVWKENKEEEKEDEFDGKILRRVMFSIDMMEDLQDLYGDRVVESHSEDKLVLKHEWTDERLVLVKN